MPADPAPNYGSSSTVGNLHILLALGCSRLLSLSMLFSAKVCILLQDYYWCSLTLTVNAMIVSAYRLPGGQEERQLSPRQWENTDLFIHRNHCPSSEVEFIFLKIILSFMDLSIWVTLVMSWHIKEKWITVAKCVIWLSSKVPWSLYHGNMLETF